jgi:hypothetical protein
LTYMTMSKKSLLLFVAVIAIVVAYKTALSE